MTASVPMPSFHEPPTAVPFDAHAICASCIENAAEGLLLDEARLPPSFFDLSSGQLGALLHELTKYRRRLALVVPNLARYSSSFRDWAREANLGDQFHVASTRDEAVRWLELEVN